MSDPKNKVEKDAKREWSDPTVKHNATVERVKSGPLGTRPAESVAYTMS